MLEVCDLTKRYGNTLAVDHVNFQVQQGEVVGFLGRNGAGKSTTMNMITGYLSASEGSVTVEGFDVLTQSKQVKQRIGYLPEVPPLYPELTAWENLEFVYRLKHPAIEKNAHLEHLCELMQITPIKSRLVQNLSKGYRQRVGLAAALVGDPPILILDEPTVGLDPSQIIEIRQLIQELSKTRTVILSSHILQEVQAVCGRIIIIHHGRIVADDTPEKLIEAQNFDRRLILQTAGDPNQVRQLLETLPGVETVEVTENQEEQTTWYYLDTAGKDLRAAAAKLLVEKEIPLLELRWRQPTLEDAFLHLTREDGEIESSQTGVQKEAGQDVCSL